jgi:hypothetical protein
MQQKNGRMVVQGLRRRGGVSLQEGRSKVIQEVFEIDVSVLSIVKNATDLMVPNFIDVQYMQGMFNRGGLHSPPLTTNY